MGIIFGVVLALVFKINYFVSPWWCLLATLLFVIAYLKPRLVFVVLALVAGMMLAFFRVATELKGENCIRQFYGEKVVVTGVANGDPESDESGTKIKLINLQFGENKKPVAGSIFISLKYNNKIAREDTVIVEGKLSEGFGTYTGYMYRPIVMAIKKPEPGSLVLKFRNWFAERIRRLVPEPQVNLGLSYLLGMKSGLPDESAENLRIVGLVHIVVASGAHLAILVEIAKKLFGKISRFSGLLFSGIFVILFMAMVGWTPSILRAGVMSILTILAWYVGRKIAPWRIILMVAALTLMLNPNFMINLGWLLSFASFAGIMILGPRLVGFFYGGKKPGFIAETIITTLAATIMTLPITLYFYGTFSLISMVANLLILPTLSYAMGLMFLVGVMAGIPGLETIIGFVATKLLDFHIAVVNLFASMRQFLVEIPVGQVWVFGIYIFIVLALLISKLILYKKKNMCDMIKT